MAELLVMPRAGAVDAAVEDARARVDALDIERSWIVEAPAGSGKTALLVQRMLKLLGDAEVTRPDEVLAITFTRAATAEMRERVLRELRSAEAGTPVRSDHEQRTRELALRVLERDRELGWTLLDEPDGLRISTIDGICSEIARGGSVVQGGNGGLPPSDDAKPLYAEAARRTWRRLGDGTDAALEAALRDVLLHRDADLSSCHELVAGMLESRDQWGSLIPLAPAELTPEALEGVVRPRLDRALAGVVCATLGRLERAMPAGFADRLAGLAAEFGAMPGYPADKPHRYAICRDLVGAPAAQAEFVQHWVAMLGMLLTQKGKWYSTLAKNYIGVELDKAQRATLKELLETVRHDERLAAAAQACRSLPPARYPDEQWAVARSLFLVLRQALVDLQAVFAERGACDFVEPALAARAAMERADGGGPERPLAEVRHLLVDEVQDTSTRQFELLCQMTAGWERERRSVFLVGDPKQSIYLFRHARVERFLIAMRTAQLGEVPLGVLRLRANFRSQRPLVEGLNRDFVDVFGGQEKEAVAGGGGDAVEFLPAMVTRESTPGVEGAAWHLRAIEKDREAGMDLRRAEQQDARAMRVAMEAWRQRPLPEKRTTPWRMAVLGRRRADLQAIVRELRAEPAIPFRALKIDPLAERLEVMDVLALVRAMLDPMDRTAWLALLRAPTCGLGLADLHRLAGEDDATLHRRPLRELVRRRMELLSDDGQRRVRRVWPVLERAFDLRAEVRLPELVERTWTTLGGDRLLDETERSNVQSLLQLLRAIDAEMGEVSMREVERRLEQLYAAPGPASAAVELLTMHNAKGLEWDVVFLPGIHRAAARTRARLLEWEELPEGNGVVLAPVQGKGEASDALNRWIRELTKARLHAERKRLLYVACTRAREELHLYGTAEMKGGEVKAAAGSLLEVAWPAAMRRADGVWTPAEEVAEPGEGLALAAGEAEDARPAVIRRLPLAAMAESFGEGSAEAPVERGGERRAGFARAEGSFAARSAGVAVHGLLEAAAAELAQDGSVERMLADLAGWERRARVLLRARGLGPAEVERRAAGVREALARTLRDPVGRWLLERRSEGRSELAISAAAEEESRSLRLDRMFRAGAVPMAPGEDTLWIVDYKTAQHGAALDRFLAEEKARYRGQMEAYAEAMGAGQTACLGLWFPMMARLVWWRAGEAAPVDERPQQELFAMRTP